MKKVLLALCLFIAGNKVIAQQQNYDASLIPKELLQNANAVIRNEQTTVEVKDLTSVVYHIKKAITILNKNGDSMAPIIIGHDQFKTLKSIKGVIFSADGKQTGKFGESNFEDVSGYDGFSLFNDIKVKHFTPAAEGYPYTIVYELEFQLKQSLYFYDWEPAGVGLAVENASYTFTCKPDFNIRYKEIHMPVKAQITDQGGLKVYSWQLSNVKAARAETYGSAELSKVKIAPEDFGYGGMKGMFNSWETLGRWEYDNLLKNRDDLPVETIVHIKEMVAGINDPKLKAKKIYEYMQQRTHYVSVQIGIGGYQPFLASDVDKLNYGDCKALVNYTHSLLLAANIPSYYCVVTAGRGQKVSMMKDFPSMDQGNHTILCLPFKSDTTWLECTSQQLPFGFLSSFTDDRTVLACTPEGGKLLHTPKYTATDNQQTRKANFTIDDKGTLAGSMETIFKGAEYDSREWAVHDSPSEQEKGIKGIYPVNNLEVKKLEFKQDKGIQPVTTEDVTFSDREFASINDGKVYFSVNPVNRSRITLRHERDRLTEVKIVRGYTNDDELSYTLPPGYHFDSKNLNISINKPYGSYSASITVNGGQLIYKRKFQFIDGTYSKDTYQDMVDFYQDVADADDYTVGLVK